MSTSSQQDSTRPRGTVQVTAYYAEPLGSEAVARLWDAVRPGTLEVSGNRVKLSTHGEEVRGLADGLADELPGAPGHVEVSWQAGDPQYVPF